MPGIAVSIPRPERPKRQPQRPKRPASRLIRLSICLKKYTIPLIHHFIYQKKDIFLSNQYFIYPRKYTIHPIHHFIYLKKDIFL